MNRRAVLDDETEFAFWKTGKDAWVRAPLRVVIAHKDKPVGESLALLVSGKGYHAVYAPDIATARAYLKCWKPHAMLFDTRLDSATDYKFMRTVRSELPGSKLLLLAMSNISPLDSIAALRKAGFDGHCRRPCSLWRIVELLDGYFNEPVDA